ncbi:MAG: isoleucine--tRNA ligase [Peptoniphilaceae bacterium]|nr:isoleucine--tRNA ligase [Peptoniphilaceae bacterium]
MNRFEELSTKDVKNSEKKISDYWDEIDLLKRSLETRENCENYIFYDGPPTANGKPGIHHVISRTLKDMTNRYKNLRGYRVERKAGWDTHGLPVEIEVEKELGISNKKEIEEYGIEKFNEKCKASVFKYKDLWEEMTKRMAFLADMDDPYITLDNDYIETEWALLDKMFKEGHIFEGHKVVPYCPRCGTDLASHEVAQGYQSDKTITLTMEFKKKNAENEYFLAWTTTPWTLPSNVALAVNPEVDYVKVLDKTRNKKYILAEALLNAVLKDDEYEIIEHMKGKELEYQEYEQLMPYLKPDKKAFFVVCADFVSVESGTGIVHTAPAFGDDDYTVGKEYKLPFVQPVDLQGKFTDTPWKGEFVFDTNESIYLHLREEGKVFAKETITHDYPHCWRCGTPLIYYAKPSWYIDMSNMREKMVEANESVKWNPQTIGDKRFGNWIANAKDRAISRQRYWGTPLNLWKGEKSGKIISIGSRKELVEKANEDIDENIELHRPYVDNVTITDKETGEVFHRVEDVMDVWFDSGAMPFAQRHFPFEHKEDFYEDYFPADFICEGIDQTRGRFYSLMSISTLITGKAPYKNVLVNDLILDKNGQKMSKSKGNTLDPFDLFDRYGADAVRFYSLYVSPPWLPTRFDETGLKEVQNNFFRTFENVYNFFSLYANTDKIDPSTYNLDYEKLELTDKWILSKLQSLYKSYLTDMDNFEYNRVVHNISDFVVEDLSNWYIRRNRKRFWNSDINESKKNAYKVTYEILKLISQMISPIAPFISESVYRKLTNAESVHLTYLPEVNENFIDKDLEEKMDLVRKIVSLARASREKEEIKVRQPLQKIVVDGSYKEKIGNFTGLIKDEINVKEVDFMDDLTQFMNYSLKPDFRSVGRIFKSKIKDFQKFLENVNAKEFIENLEKEDQKITLSGEEILIKREYVDVRISAKEGFDVEMDKNVFVVLDTEITQELKDEGYAREFISKVQNMRKDNGFELTDRIIINYEAEEELEKSLIKFKDQIMKETLADDFKNLSLEESPIDLNDKKIKLKLNKVN